MFYNYLILYPSIYNLLTVMFYIMYVLVYLYLLDYYLPSMYPLVEDIRIMLNLIILYNCYSFFIPCILLIVACLMDIYGYFMILFCLLYVSISCRLCLVLLCGSMLIIVALLGNHLLLWGIRSLAFGGLSIV